MRARMEETASARNLKRGPGGTVDVEFVVQMLQLRYARQSPEVLVPGTLSAMNRLHEAGHLSADDCQFLSRAYRYLRSIEARLRLMNTAARHDLPEDAVQLAKLAYLLNCAGPEQLVAECEQYTAEIRQRFEQLFAAVG